MPQNFPVKGNTSSLDIIQSNRIRSCRHDYSELLWKGLATFDAGMFGACHATSVFGGNISHSTGAADVNAEVVVICTVAEPV